MEASMCELMGMSFAKPVVASVSIQAFSKRSEENADGWGLAWYPDRSLAMIKQPLRWSVQHTQFLEHYPGLLSSIYVAHVRQRTVGSASTHADTHPFSRELNGREYCFAHNGTLTGDFWHRPLGRFRPIGHTDSEYLFCLLLAELDQFARVAGEVEEARLSLYPEIRPTAHRPEQADDGLHSERQWKWLHQYLFRLNDFGKLNCILTDGERMFVYHDKNAWKNLTYRNIFLHEDSMNNFGDATLAVHLQAAPVNHGVIVATNPLSVDGWQQFLPGEMKVLHQGGIVFSGRAGLHDGTPGGKAAADSVLLLPTAKAANAVLTGEKAGT
jgi:predicted glutamine amidotransferase